MNPTRILLIEDSPSDAMLVESLLKEDESFHHTLKCAPRLSSGLLLARHSPFDVVLTDLQLPDSCGLATFEALHQAAPKLPIIILTIDKDTESALGAIKMGAQDYLSKNHFDSFSLVRTINYAIERQHITLQLQKTLAAVKTLSGMLPICASCKKIRDDKGYWNPVEVYFTRHVHASFSHGICPDCEKTFLKEV